MLAEDCEAERIRYERKQLESELNRWGRWIESHYDYQGFPTVNILEAMRTGSGGGTLGHKILCLDMPEHIYCVHGRVLRLPEAEQEAVLIKYCVKVKEDGTLWTKAEVCLRAGINPESFEQRLWRARRRILGLPVD